MYKHINSFLRIIHFILFSTIITAQEEVSLIGVRGNCEMCKERIEKIAGNIPGVLKTNYSIDLQTLAIVVNASEFDEIQLYRELSDKGHDTDRMIASDEAYKNLPLCCQYPRDTDELIGHRSETLKEKVYQMRVEGNCGMCHDRIEEAAFQVLGVIDGHWDQNTKTLRVEIDPIIFNELELHRAIASVGHDTDKIRASKYAYENLHTCCKYRDDDKSAQLVGMVYQKNEKGNKEVLIGATIRLLERDLGTYTDIEGSFSLPIQSGDRHIVVSYVGFTPDTVAISGPGYVEIVIESGTLLPGVEIVRRKKSAEISYVNPIKVTKISERELTKAACCNLSESFETTPSVDVSFSDAVTGTRTIEMLGLAGTYVQINRQNMPDIRGLAAITGFTFVPGPWIEGIQLTSGVGSVLNGYESIAGQINVELKKPWDKEKLYLNAYYNMNGRAEANWVQNFQLNENWMSGILLHYNQRSRNLDQNNDGFLDMPKGKTIVAANTWRYEGYDGNEADFGVKYTNSSTISGQSGWNRNIPSDLWGMYSDIERLEVWAKRGKVLLNKENTSFGLQAGGLLHRQQSLFGNRAYSGNQKMLYLNGLYATQIKNPTHKITSGISLMAENYDETFIGKNFERTEIVPGIFSEYTYSIEEKFTAVAGMRLDYHNIFGLFATPRLHLRYAIDENTVLRASVGRGQRTANIIAENMGLLASNRMWKFESDLDNGRPYGMNPEVAWNYGLNLTKYLNLFARELTWSLDLYHTRFQNQIVIDLDQSARTVSFYNLEGDSYSNSIQTMIEYHPLLNFDVRLAYRFNDVRNTYSGELLEKPLVSRHRAFLNLAYETKSAWRFDYTLNWQGSRRLPFTADNPEEFRLEERSPSYFISNAQVSKLWGDKLEVYLGGENLFNFTQPNPILSSSDPWAPFFDASMIWGPINEVMYYVGFRYKLFRE